MQWEELDQQPCSLARTLSVIGDRWTLLILRDCFMKVRRFDDFHARLGIGRPILADRLQKLVDNFVLTKVAYQTNPLRHEYRLTPKGLDLHPVVMSIVHWGDVHMAGKKGRPVLHRHLACDHHFDPVLVCSHCGDPVTARDMVIEPGPGAAALRPEPAPPADRPAKAASGQVRRSTRAVKAGAG
jgi:DNA-binding HxlR family transcriptional regulator